ncbi:hypothetical protein Sgly_1700 [Syntrophobotulus glycolicus DSM 8271]|uniref:Uncharacterized protein n=1 Tax=Syntrophobotulus glycolicus (strain DSM 8271 / FlGlyR) TaxID=645991 RepID=F0SYW0_SYNGF|nr:hypothetical protein Sgly_1700 [Syntrophobotulus glycolicus DSM 8271]
METEPDGRHMIINYSYLTGNSDSTIINSNFTEALVSGTTDRSLP